MFRLELPAMASAVKSFTVKQASNVDSFDLMSRVREEVTNSLFIDYTVLIREIF